ncbi:LOW QUALITY PROTEIN: hypothetical protein BT93_E0269 [Corymbia citriodora subsp. variegata]|nr:LOW QUALITY PROTEIN: hypothetical protein BT93_E0269 [Corymbia citriodora subsp. variegata]
MDNSKSSNGKQFRLYEEAKLQFLDIEKILKRAKACEWTTMIISSSGFILAILNLLGLPGNNSKQIFLPMQRQVLGAFIFVGGYSKL